MAWGFVQRESPRDRPKKLVFCTDRKRVREEETKQDNSKRVCRATDQADSNLHYINRPEQEHRGKCVQQSPSGQHSQACWEAWLQEASAARLELEQKETKLREGKIAKTRSGRLVADNVVAQSRQKVADLDAAYDRLRARSLAYHSLPVDIDLKIWQQCGPSARSMLSQVCCEFRVLVAYGRGHRWAQLACGAPNKEACPVLWQMDLVHIAHQVFV